MSARLFVAVDVPAPYADRLRELHDSSLGVRWTPPAQLHLTLRFIGDVPRVEVPDVEGVLATVRGEPFALETKGLAAFPSRRRPRVLVLRTTAAPPLRALHAGVEDALRGIGITADPKPFSPHVTFARVKRAGARDVRRYMQRHAHFALAPFTVSSFCLYESSLRPEGAHHERLATYSLAG